MFVFLAETAAAEAAGRSASSLLPHCADHPLQTMGTRLSSAVAAAVLAYVPLYFRTAEAFCPKAVGTAAATTALSSPHHRDTPQQEGYSRRTAFPACSAAPAPGMLPSRVFTGRRKRRREFTLLLASAESSSGSEEFDDSQELTNQQQQQQQQQLPSPAADAAADVELVDKGGVSKDRLAFEELGTREVDRLFSTLEPCDVSGFRRKPANLLDSASLIGGTAVGAGILALPAATLQAGVLPSSVGLVMMWVYMVCTGLLIAEVNVNVICSQGTPGVGLIALAEQALGKGGARFTGLVYVFIHYSLLVAYMAQGGGILTESFNSVFATVGSSMAALPEWTGPVAFCFALGSLVLFFSEEFVASFNSVLVAVVLLSFVGLVGVGSGGVHSEYLTQQDWSKVPSTVPVLYIALVFHNVVPVVTTQLEGDVDKIRKAIIGGSLAPLVMFLVWNAVILGSVSKDAGLVAEAAGGVFDPLQALRSSAGSAEGSAALIGPLVSIFSEVAIVTSFIGFIVGLLDFFTDVLKIPPGDTSKEIPLYGAILLPPLGVAVTDPDIFFAALDTAGTFGISLLCGVLPAAMAWRQRYGGDSTIATLPLVPGGKATLAGIAGFAGVVIFQKLLEMAGLTLPA